MQAKAGMQASHKVTVELAQKQKLTSLGILPSRGPTGLAGL
jgi:hypothetical protein